MSDTKSWGRHEGVAVFMRRPDKQIYMARRTAQNRPFFGMFAAPGGSVEEGETALVAAVRELEEETGLVIDATRLVSLGRRGPIVTPVEEQGSGMPYHMNYYFVNLRVDEIPKCLEPAKQGKWQLGVWVDWILDAPLCPGAHEMIELMTHLA